MHRLCMGKHRSMSIRVMITLTNSFCRGLRAKLQTVPIIVPLPVQCTKLEFERWPEGSSDPLRVRAEGCDVRDECVGCIGLLVEAPIRVPGCEASAGCRAEWLVLVQVDLLSRIACVW